MLHEVAPVGQSKNTDRVSALKKINDKYNYGGMVFPADYTSIEAFEELSQVCIFIYEIDEEGKLRLSKVGKIEYLTLDFKYLLRIENGEESHYIYIKNIAHLLNLSTQTGDNDKRCCPICPQKVPLNGYSPHTSASATSSQRNRHA